MKKFLKLFSVTVFSFILLYINSYATPTVLLKGDINGDNIVNASDTRAVLRAVTGDDPAPAVGSEKYQRMKLIKETDDITMEDVRAVNRVALGVADYSDHYSTNELINIVDLLVNQILNEPFISSHSMTVFSRTESSSDIYDYLPGEKLNYLSSTDIKELTGCTDANISGVSYTKPIKTAISASETYFPTENKVSTLSASDIKSLKIELCRNVNILKDFPDTYKADNITYNLQKYKDVTVDNLLKLSVETDKEDLIYADKNSGIINTTKLQTELQNMLTYNSADKIYGGKFINSVTLTSTFVSVTAEFYFSCKSFEPIAAIYKVNTENYRSATIKFISDDGTSDQSSFKNKITRKTENFHLFSGFYN